MTASELAYLGLGLLLGAASGAALVVILGTRLPRREIRVTVTRDVVPRRSETLSQGAFAAHRGEPARGGPGDRRQLDRDDAEGRPGMPDERPLVGIPVGPGPATPVTAASAVGSAPNRTIVPSPATPDAVAIDPTSTLVVSSLGVAVAGAPERSPEELRKLPAGAPALERILRGEHLAMVEVLDILAGTDSLRRREWELLLGGLVEALAEAAVSESVIDFPLGTAFWDSFTVEQCRRIVGALASMGYRYDGRAGWLDGRVPAYRDLSQALADIGLEPRRMRDWPNSSEIAALFTGARAAPEELLAAAGPDYGADAMRSLLADGGDSLADLWLAWDSARPVLLGGASED